MPAARLTYKSWSELLGAARSSFFEGEKADVAFDRSRRGRRHIDVPAPNVEALFTQSNARVLLGHGACGTLRFVALPTQLYPAPTGTPEFGLGPGMYHHFDVLMYLGDLAFSLRVEDGDDEEVLVIPITSAQEPSGGLCSETAYADGVLPVSGARTSDLEVVIVSFAPVAPDARTAPLAPAPLPGPAGAFHVLVLRNLGSTTLHGKVVLKAADLLIGHYEDARPERRALTRPTVSLRRNTLLLSQPWGTAGIHLHDGTWTRTEAPFEAETPFELAPGAECAVEACVALGAGYAEVLPTIYELHMHAALEWLNRTGAFWRERLGALTVDAVDAGDEATCSRDIYVRSLLDNFNCLQTDAAGELLAHWQGAPSHGYGTVWGIDVEPTATSIVHICPELAWAALAFFAERSRPPKGPPDHSLPILVAPVIIARQWLQVTGDAERLARAPALMGVLRGIMDDVLALKAPGETLFPTRYASDGAVGRRYDYGTNVKIWYAFDSMAYLAQRTGDTHAAGAYRETAAALRAAIARRLAGNGPFGRQIIGGTNLGEAPGSFYLAESAPGKGAPYYDGEDTSTMLAPTYGLVDLCDTEWVNYHRFARSPWCPNFDPEFGALRWSPRGFAGGALDGTAFISRLAGSITRREMIEALHVLCDRAIDEVTGSLFWWPHGLEYKRSLTRCSQGQGAYAWHYLKHWLGLEVDAESRTLTIAPRGLLTSVAWQGFRAGPHTFDILWQETPSTGDDLATLDAAIDTGATSPWQSDDPDERFTFIRITNHNTEPWIVRTGLRPPMTGAGGPLTWRSGRVEPGTTLQMLHTAVDGSEPEGLPETAMVARTVAAQGSDGIVFRRYGAEQLWGHWELEALWDPGAMPLTLRFLVVNGTGRELDDVNVWLTCPSPWVAQGRPPRLWQRPTALNTEASVDLGALPHLHQDVAPFWVVWPPELDLVLDWHERGDVPFHADTQPGPGITLYARNVTEPLEAIFTATLTAVPSDHRRVTRQINVPVKVLPYRR